MKTFRIGIRLDGSYDPTSGIVDWDAVPDTEAETPEEAVALAAQYMWDEGMHESFPECGNADEMSEQIAWFLENAETGEKIDF